MTKIELIVLLLAIAFVLIAEMINTAIEGAIDVATSSFDPMAKLAKDIAAGAVLIATINAVAVGYLVFSGKTASRTARLIDKVRDAPAELTIVALVVTVFIVIAVKAWTGSGTPLRGGLPSGHAAVAFACWMALTYVAASRTASSSRRSPSSWPCSSLRRASSPASTPPSRCSSAACSAPS